MPNLTDLNWTAMTMLSGSLFSGWGWALYVIQTSYCVLYLMLIGRTFGGWSA